MVLIRYNEKGRHKTDWYNTQLPKEREIEKRIQLSYNKLKKFICDRINKVCATKATID